MTAEHGKPCPRCAGLEQRLQFRPCGYAAPGAAWCEVAMPDGRAAQGWLCRPHQVLLDASGAFGLQLLAGRGGEAGPCGWRVPAEEGMEGEEVPGDFGYGQEEVTARGAR